ncbi:hypothetical protein GO755_36795 [Spirosoma sp. HMF4905]|uniref:Uncharacterized protein n=1 Tax=Spirosoma arboris TaxID=2682092 RepID=A0A7K1SP95_9BACT|nr:hypothetical protein [Spirosoma arboris]MVM35634.1 hypothetical protein [Spirosoma arboris]
MPRLFLPYLLTTLVGWLCVSYSWAQAVFRVDSLPANGILLNKAWKWHLGDNPAWAKPEFDDSRWDTLNPAQLISTLDKLPQQGIG